MKPNQPQVTNLADSKVVAQVKDQLDQSLNDIPAHVRERLHAARKQAVAHAERARHTSTAVSLSNTPCRDTQFQWDKLWRPFAPIASAAAFAAVIIYINVATTVPAFDPDWEQDTELLYSADDFELYEDLEFYAWLAEVENG